MIVKKLGWSLPLVLALTACGGSGDDNSSTNGSNNTGNQNSNIQCNKGIPSGMAPLGNGLFDQPLYSIETEYSPEDHELLEAKTELIQHVLYQQTTSITNPQNYDDSEGNGIFDYLLNKNGLFTTKHYAATQFGWPLGYVSKMNNSTTTFSGFNDQCDLSLDAGDHQYQVIDLSGKPFSTLFETDGTISEEYDPNTLRTNYKYLDVQVMDFLKPNTTRASEAELKRQQNYSNMLASNTIFPSGSYVYVMTQTKQHDTTYAFDEEPTKLTNLEDWVKNFPIAVQWKKLTVANYPVLQIFKDNGRLDCVKDPAIQKDGKIYDGECQAADQTEEEFKRNRVYYMNATTRNLVRAQLKTHYSFN